ncbi:orotidine-5'-phosphate decarboxylase [Parvimonas micra]|uniref:Orotidine 5'-phosphate decarboxylase n=1 Tax=Parvimonas micra TaxID=33033 RepID=A0A930H5C7_9FIRM|nr:orotidine-5'-phosphate decarboxylase [Parvimonas micra]MBF1307194.1 orotidine-5'-phosphate decarboxylase [Parvimonas micra]MEB3060405.1 orotidine-5'-phosphate decarboxylase [Parvimonas micra]MEB3066262.1 orotidine-5'-phosphate decarboxylase [Parvimonas micra]
MIIDRLYEAVKEKGFVCVGLDSHLDYIPNYIKEKHEKISDIIFEYNKTIIDATSDIVAIYKPQIAYYEANGLEGLIAYQRTLRYLKEKGLLSIGDVKRGDIASTAKEYAKAHFKGEFEADFITLNPYMGMDSITPYLDYLKTGEKGVFVLLRTSNEGAKDIECLDYNGEALYFKVGDELKKFADELTSECGYSPLGFVVGATHSEEAKKIRERYKNIFFLLPGYGAQGAKAEDIRTYLNDFNGGVVNSSRGIIKYYQKFEDGEERFAHYTREAVLNMRKDIYGE